MRRSQRWRKILCVDASKKLSIAYDALRFLRTLSDNTNVKLIPKMSDESNVLVIIMFGVFFTRMFYWRERKTWRNGKRHTMEACSVPSLLSFSMESFNGRWCLLVWRILGIRVAKTQNPEEGDLYLSIDPRCRQQEYSCIVRQRRNPIQGTASTSSESSFI